MRAARAKERAGREGLGMSWTVSETFILMVLLARSRTPSSPRNFSEVYGPQSLKLWDSGDEAVWAEAALRHRGGLADSSMWWRHASGQEQN